MWKKNMVLCLVLLSAITSAKSQEAATEDTCKHSVDLNVGVDLMSSFVWRGSEISNTPSIQPTLSLTVGNFEIGLWGAFSVMGTYNEVDLYAKYSIKNVSLTVTDYYVPFSNGVAMAPDTRYFIYDDALTAHTLEGTLQYKRPEKIPFWVMGSVYFFGNDKRYGYNEAKDTTDQTYYSSYFEAGYSFEIKKNTLDVFLGFTPAAGAYGNTLGVVNAGITGGRVIPITKDFELPLKASLMCNPQKSNVYFLIGISL